jgi:hypothetical protein
MLPRMPRPAFPARRRLTPARQHAAPLLGALLLAALLAAAPKSAVAQRPPAAPVPVPAATPSVGTGIVKGTVVTDRRVPVGGAQIRFGAVTGVAESDESGQFSAGRLSPGPLWLRIRRIGYRPESLLVVVGADRVVDTTVVMTPIAQALAAVKVLGRRDMSGPMAGFYKRLQMGSGRFFTAADIARRQPSQMTDLLRTVPGIRIETRGFDNRVRIRGNRCAPLVWLDGQALFAGEFDLDSVDPNSFEGIEVYNGPAAVPVEFLGNQRVSSSCGTILLWSRRGELREKKRKAGEPTPAARIAQLIEELQVFTAADVDVAAHVDSTAIVRPVYPDSLFDALVPGDLLAEFVVDTDGEAVIETFNIITASHRSLIEPVRRAVREQRFRPAVRQGKTVQQVMQLPFTFVPDSSARRR